LGIATFKSDSPKVTLRIEIHEPQGENLRDGLGAAEAFILLFSCRTSFSNKNRRFQVDMPTTQRSPPPPEQLLDDEADTRKTFEDAKISAADVAEGPVILSVSREKCDLFVVDKLYTPTSGNDQ
jgi:hypothetical protein